MKKKLLVRSKSETDWFSDKQSLEIVNNNLKNMKNITKLKKKKEKPKQPEPEIKKENKQNTNIGNIANNNLKTKKSLMNSNKIFKI